MRESKNRKSAMERVSELFELSTEALELMGKGLQSLHPKELDLIVALCEAHNGTCEFIELSEKSRGATGRSAMSGLNRDAAYKTVGREQLGHAEIFIKQARVMAAQPEDAAKLQELIAWYQVLVGRLG